MTKEKAEESKNGSEIVEYRKEALGLLNNEEAMKSLTKTVFNGLKVNNIAKAVVEARMNGFALEDFYKKNIYAIPFGDNYSLVTSIKYLRERAKTSGLIGKSEPIFTYKDEEKTKIESCSITVYEKEGHEKGYTAKVFFDEYTTGRNLWKTKPHTMTAKVAEVHALRSAFPELNSYYVEEEFEREQGISEGSIGEQVIMEGMTSELKEQVDNIKTIKEFNEFYKKNKGKGKEFDKYMLKKKDEIKNK